MNGRIKIHHISDTHGHHNKLTIPDDVDIIIHSGDFSDHRNLDRNIPEALDFIEWYHNLDVKHKILVAGNHDSMAALDEDAFRSQMVNSSITYLENEYIEIEGIKIYGSPLSPTFGDWHFMKARHKIGLSWDYIPEDTDILITHGPPKGIMDLIHHNEGYLFRCGCKSLYNHITGRLNLRYHMFGHIHSNGDINNAGVSKLANIDTVFSNGSVVTDGIMRKPTSNGNTFYYEK